MKKNHLKWQHHVRIRKRMSDTRGKFYLRSLASMIHFFGAALSLVFLVVGVFLSVESGAYEAASVAIFGSSAIALFLASGIMHLFVDGYRVSSAFEVFLERIDKCSIYVLIAGTYTAVVTKALEYPRNAQVIALIWGLAFLGSLYIFFDKKLPKLLQHRAVSTGQFVLMGWIVLFFFREVVSKLSSTELALIAAGGSFYTIGAVFYAIEKPNFSKYFGYHELWHVLVVLGCCSFFTAVLLFYAT